MNISLPKIDLSPYKIRFGIIVYTTWFLVHFIICLLPLGITFFISSTVVDLLFNSFLAYSYTLLISSLYYYTEKSNNNKLIFWFSLLFVFLSLILYVAYPSLIPAPLLAAIRESLILISFIIFLVLFCLTLIMNNNFIYSLYKKQVQQYEKERREKMKNNIENEMRNKLTKNL
jgi:hypothetical protein